MKTAYCNHCESHVKVFSDFGHAHEFLYYCVDCDTEVSCNFKFCILAAGRSTRNNDVDGLHKALLPLENKPIISHIIDKLDQKIEIVIAVGYKSEQIKSYMDEVHSNRKITYITIDNYNEPGSGPGYSLLSCKDELQCPFIFTSVDTIVKEDTQFNFLGENWLGVSNIDIDDSLNYCLVRGSKYLDTLYYGTGNRAYIGMAGICDYKEFWNSLENRQIVKDEYQVIHGFDGLEHIKLIDFTWYDTGNNKSYAETKKYFPNEIVANKSDEALFIDNNKVIKYFNDSNRAKIRVERVKYLNNTCPKVTKLNDNMYSYDYIQGQLLSDVYDEEILSKFFNYFSENLFNPNILYDPIEFEKNCKFMYEDKTRHRLVELEGSKLDLIKKINGVEVEPIYTLLDKIDWQSFYDNAIPTLFHGDLQPENIIYTWEKEDKFILIDWRDTFGKSKKVGDANYDLAKLYHALMINGKNILNEYYDCKYTTIEATIHFNVKSNLLYFKDIFKQFCISNGFNWKIIELLGVLQYLNICTLYKHFHKGRYGEFLFLYGKLMLTKKLNENYRWPEDYGKV